MSTHEGSSPPSPDRDRHVLADEAMEKIQLQGVDLGFLGVTDRVREMRQHRLPQDHLVMFGVEGPRDELRVVGLVRRLAETQAERLDHAGVATPDHRHDRAGVDPPREGDAERNVRQELAIHRRLVVAPDALEPRVAGEPLVGVQSTPA